MRAVDVFLLPIVAMAAACSFDWDTYDPRGAVGGVGGEAGAAGGGEGGSGGSDAGGGGTAGAGGAGACDITAPFQTPRLLAELNTADDEDDPILLPGSLEIIFESTRSGSGDLYHATRSDLDSPWSTPTPIDELNTDASSQTVPTISSDGLTLAFSDSDLSTILLTTRPSLSSAWSTPTLIAELDLTGQQVANHLFPGELAMIIASGHGGDLDIYTTERDSTAAPWSTPVAMPGINTADAELDFWLSPDELRAYFTSGRNGSLDIFHVNRPTAGAPWSEPVVVDELSMDDTPEADAWLSLDECRVVFARNGELYEATR